ncbi:TPA: ead/Ea22-like family protein [Enterobacter kobei]
MKDEDIAMNSRPMSNIDKQKLREAAEKATPGEWKRMMRNSDELMTTFHGIAIGNVFVELTTGKRDIFDAEFIAASNPATMLALLDELEAAEKRIAELERKEQHSERQSVIDALAGSGEEWSDIEEYMQKWDAERASAAGKGE